MPQAQEAADDLEIIRCYTPAGQRPPGPPPRGASSFDNLSAWAGSPSPKVKQEPPRPQLAEELAEEADKESHDDGSKREPWKQLPVGNWQDSQEKLRQEWHQKLNGRQAAEKPHKRASLRAAAGERRAGTLRGSASLSASVANSMAPSRSSFSPANSPRSADIEDVEQPSSPSGLLGSNTGSPSGGPDPIFGPPPGWKTAAPSSGPAPFFGAPPGWQASPMPGPGPLPGMGPGPAFTPTPKGGPRPGCLGRGLGPGPALGPAPPNQRPNQPNWAFCAP